MLSVLIPTLNEARNLEACLDSVAWADELVVVDSGSTDETCVLAEAHGATVVQFQWNGRWPKKKNWALETVPWQNEWILILDADERVSAALASEIQDELKAPRASGYLINRRFVFLGKWIRHCGYYPSWNIRLFRHSHGRFEPLHTGDTGSGDNEVHEHVLLHGPAACLQNDLLHYAYPNIYTWMEKHNRYSNWEAEIEVAANLRDRTGDLWKPLARRRRLRTWSRRLPFRPALRFFYSYVLQRGFLDGYEGYVFCRLLAAYEMLNVFKAQELRRQKLKR